MHGLPISQLGMHCAHTGAGSAGGLDRALLLGRLRLVVPVGRPRHALSHSGAGHMGLAQQQGFNERFRLPATRHEAIDTATARLELCGRQILLHL